MSPTPPNASQRQPDLALLTAGNDTGWWDEHGRPAPWPEDYWLPDGSINPDWQNTSTEEEPEPAKPSENHNI
jgi:hypothetical protein